MSDVVHFGTEETPCLDPNGMGCTHPIAAHAYAAAGCSYIGTSGWCLCFWYPEREGAAELLELTVSSDYEAAPREKAAGQNR